jgi:flagellar basal body rod protein FlgC
MPTSINNLGDSNIATAEKQSQMAEKAYREKNAVLNQQINNQAAQKSDESRRRETASVEAGKGQQLSVTA